MSKIEVKTNLTSRQFRLYDYLKAKGDQWTTQFQIVNDLRELYHYAEDDLVTFHDNPARKQLTNDIRAINESDYLPKPILSGCKGVKIANEKEFDLFIGANINAVIRRLKRLKNMAKKGDKNGQFRLKLSEYQKDIHEAFVD